jgi:hypothetical protein
MVQTEFASMCADDDVVFPGAIADIVDFLKRNRDHSAAHGWYFQFYLEGALGMTSILYRSPSLDADDHFERLYRLFASYEAITYAVHRTAVLKRVLFYVQGMRSMLARELLGGALAVIAGKVARLPIMYSGRSLGPSVSYLHWHPIEFLAGSPAGLWQEYGRYKAKLFEYRAELGIGSSDQEEADRLVDLAHVRYLADYFRPEVIDHVYEEVRRGRTPAELMQGVWPILAKGQTLGGRSALRKLGERAVSKLRHIYARRATAQGRSYRTLETRTANGVPRGVDIYEAFESAATVNRITPSTAELVSLMAGYE